MAENVEPMEVDDGPVRHLLSIDSIKIMGESVGITTLNDDAATRLAEDLEYRLKEVVQDAIKFMRHSKRRRLTCADIDQALRVKNIEPLYGFDCTDYIPFRHTSGGGKDIYFPDEKEVNLVDLVSSPLPRLPSDISMRSHWLCVEGVQPTIPENPPPLSLEDQKAEALASTLPAVQPSDPIAHAKEIRFEKKGKKKEDPESVEWSRLKPLQAHALSLEQQLYYKEITDACVGLTSESRCQEALSSLTADPGLYQLLPQFTSFITEGVRVNVTQRKLAVLKHLMKMAQALLENSALTLEKFLHELIPAVFTCLLNKQICLRPESEDHWSLRELAAKILAKICKKYSNSINNIQSRITRTLSNALKSNTQGLSVHFGALAGLTELGQEVTVSLVIPKLKQIGEFMKQALSPPVKLTEQVAASKLQNLLQRQCGPILMHTRSATDSLQHYQEDYGHHLGTALYNQVKNLRQNRASLPSTVTIRPTLKSPTTPTSAGAGKPTNRPPPLTLPSAQLLALKNSGGNGGTSPKVQSPILASPTLAAAAVRLVSQVTGSSPGTPTSSSAVASLLTAVMNNPTALAGHLAALSGSSSPSGSSSGGGTSATSTSGLSKTGANGSTAVTTLVTTSPSTAIATQQQLSSGVKSEGPQTPKTPLTPQTPQSGPGGNGQGTKPTVVATQLPPTTSSS
jgi:transcription initiation factor TFIID subunit 6